MPYQYKLHPVAQKEYESSLSWYLERSLDAAKTLLRKSTRHWLKFVEIRIGIVINIKITGNMVSENIHSILFMLLRNNCNW